MQHFFDAIALEVDYQRHSRARWVAMTRREWLAFFVGDYAMGAL